MSELITTCLGGLVNNQTTAYDLALVEGIRKVYGLIGDQSEGGAGLN